MEAALFASLCTRRSGDIPQARAYRIAAYRRIGRYYINQRQIGRRTYGRVTNATDLIPGQLISVTLIRDTSLITAREVKQIRPRNVARSAVRDVIQARQDAGCGYRQRALVVVIHAQIGDKDPDIIVSQSIGLDFGTGSERCGRSVTRSPIDQNTTVGRKVRSRIRVTRDGIVCYLG